MTLQILKETSKKDTNSWAIWDKCGNEDFQFYVDNLSKLHGRVIFLGLNRSDGAKKETQDNREFKNFHKQSHVGDNRLKRLIQLSSLNQLIGGFMTDISQQVETKSNKVKITENAFDDFLKNVEKIPSKDRFVICFGDKVFNYIKKKLDVSTRSVISNSDIHLKKFSVEYQRESWNFYRVWHYSNYGRFIHKSEDELPLQLDYINGEVKRNKK